MSKQESIIDIVQGLAVEPKSVDKLREKLGEGSGDGVGFPMWYDLLAIVGLFLLARFVTAVIVAAMGWEVSLPEGFDAMSQTLRRAAEQSMGKTIFFSTMIMQPLMLFATLVYRTIRRGSWGKVRHSLNGFNPTMLLWGVVMIVALVVVMEPLMQLFPQPPTPEGRGIFMILALLVAAPLFEELLCRGVILESIRSKWGAWRGCVISAFIFGFMHQSPQGVINAFVIGLLLGYIYLKTNSIFAPIILHAVNNLFAYALILFGVSGTTLWELSGGGTIYTVIYACAVAIMILSTFAMIHFMAKLRKADRSEFGLPKFGREK
ncbi:MAG: CPBP family intramembrane glutamic endopeptidase [Rikenellaceae bacterium]